MKVTFYYRKQGCAFSIEQVFSDVRVALPSEIEQNAYFCRHRVASPRAMWENCQRAKKHRGDINHITGEVHYLALTLPRRGLVLTIHDTGDTNAFTGWKKRLFEYLWYSGPIKRASAVTFISDATRQAVERMIGRKISHAEVIPDPVSPAFKFSPKPFPISTPRILCLGTKVNKNLERLAMALSGLDIELRLIGEPNQQQLKVLEINGVKFTTACNLTTEEIVQEYMCADIVGLVSTFEGFGLPIIEGQAIGRPVITSNIAPMTDTAGKGACLVDPFDVASIRGGVERLIKDPTWRASLIENGRANAQRYSAEAIAHRYASLYTRLVKS
ncbi:glycosyltransferase [Cerasicoccus fimbriatus]|uniref:glycosyltransferase n=1 Tax=Cerasicoccus fimbriatus TaxID=3014554 RepID=UPI0022B31370|nr:glycosyltransferase [Cerasicoccus sp. TK19100]